MGRRLYPEESEAVEEVLSGVQEMEVDEEPLLFFSDHGSGEDIANFIRAARNGELERAHRIWEGRGLTPDDCRGAILQMFCEPPADDIDEGLSGVAYENNVPLQVVEQFLPGDEDARRRARITPLMFLCRYDYPPERVVAFARENGITREELMSEECMLWTEACEWGPWDQVRALMVSYELGINILNRVADLIFLNYERLEDREFVAWVVERFGLGALGNDLRQRIIGDN